MLRRPSPLLPTSGWAGAGKGRQRAKFSENIKRVLLLAGIAIVLIYCGLSFTSLSGGARGGFRIIPGAKTKSARALAEENAQLQQPQRPPLLGGANGSGGAVHAGSDGHNHAPDEPCDESCQKHHSHAHSGVHAGEEGVEAGEAGSTEPARFTLSKPLSSPLYSMVADNLDGQPVELKAFAGKVLLVTNVASACGFTEQNYRGLQRLYDKFRDRGFEARARCARAEPEHVQEDSALDGLHSWGSATSMMGAISGLSCGVDVPQKPMRKGPGAARLAYP